jgi:hypothetical protein
VRINEPGQLVHIGHALLAKLHAVAKVEALDVILGVIAQAVPRVCGVESSLSSHRMMSL